MLLATPCTDLGSSTQIKHYTAVLTLPSAFVMSLEFEILKQVHFDHVLKQLFYKLVNWIPFMYYK